MPFKPLDFIKKKKQSERPEPSIPIIILSAVDADDNWYVTLSDWVFWLYNLSENIKEYLPHKWFYSNGASDIDDRILNEQLKQKNLRNKFNRLKMQRDSVNRGTFYEDLARSEHRVKICKNWHDDEVHHLKQQRARSEGFIPELRADSDYSQVPGWDSKTTNFRGQTGLCEDLQCLSKNRPDTEISTQVSLKDEQPYSNPIPDHSQAKIFDLEEKNEKCWNENRVLSERIVYNLEACNDKLEKCFERSYVSESSAKQSYPSHSNLQELPSAISRIKYERPSAPGDWDHARLLGYGSVMEKISNLFLLPITLCDSRAVYYRGRAPFFILRYAYASLTVFIYFQICSTIFALIRYSLLFLPEPPEPLQLKKKRERLEEKQIPATKRTKKIFGKNRLKKEIELEGSPESTINLNIRELLRGILNLRGGSTRDNLSKIDPVFLLIHLEKLRQKMELEVKTVPKKRINKPFRSTSARFKGLRMLHKSSLGYILTAAVAFNSSSIFQTRTEQRTEATLNRVRTLAQADVKKIQPNGAGVKQLSREIQLGAGKMISFKSESVVKNEVLKETSNTAPSRPAFSGFKKTRFKTKHLSDLPPLADDDFMDTIAEPERIYKPKIKIKYDS